MSHSEEEHRPLTQAEERLLEMFNDHFKFWDLEHGDPAAHLNTPGLTQYSRAFDPEFTQPIPGLRRVVMYYPVVGNYFHRVEYVTTNDISALQVLESIIEFYRQPFTQENLEAIRYQTNTPYREIGPNETVLDQLDPARHLESLDVHEDGF